MMHASAGPRPVEQPRERSCAPAPGPCSEAKQQSHLADAASPMQQGHGARSLARSLSRAVFSACGRAATSWLSSRR